MSRCRPILAALLAILAACAGVPPPQPQPGLPTYEYVGIDLLTSTRGHLYRSGNCVLLGRDRPIVPVWPRGTRMSEEGLTLPAVNGGAFLRFGEVAYVHGGHLPDLAGSSQPNFAAAAACGAHGFLVNRAESQRQKEAEAPRPPYTSGSLVRRGSCMLIDNAEGALLLIWPPGTEVTPDTVVTPNLRGHSPLLVGRWASVEGRYVHSDDGSLQRAAGAEAAKCAGRGMLVEKANRVYLARDAAELAANSDSVAVVELVEFNDSEPLQDGFLTTLVARVVEPLAGGLRSGDVVRLRHPSGRHPARGWQGTAHDMLFTLPREAMVKPGNRMLLFVNQDFYRQMAQARDGSPAPGHIGVGGGLWRLENGRIINERDLQMPATLDELRRQIQGR